MSNAWLNIKELSFDHGVYGFITILKTMVFILLYGIKLFLRINTQFVFL
jgi:hypothetical protein